MSEKCKYHLGTIFPILCIFLSGVFFFSCSKNTEKSSFAVSLETVDSFIQQGQSSDALRLLKKTSKSAYSAPARIGIYRRFITLGDKSLAEKTLAKALRKLPENKELRAVYAHFLLREGRTDEALKVSAPLSSSKYGSIYAEAVLKSNKENDLLSMELSPVYRDCYVATGDGKWLVNAALPFLKAGNYGSAASLLDKIENNEALFWAAVEYDAGNYDLCIDCLEYAKSNGIMDKTIPLSSDSYIMLGDYDSAEKEREKLISRAEIDSSLSVPPLVYVNSAIWSYNAKQYARAYSLLMKVIMNNPDNVPALLAYGKFARIESSPEEQDMFEQTLRKTTLRSFTMQQKDERPRFLISDALYRIDSLLEKQSRVGQKDGKLVVERLSLWLGENSSLPQNKLESEIWKTLEMNETGTDLYPQELVQFAVAQLLVHGKEEEARGLFSKYLDARYKMKNDSGDGGEKNMYDVFGGEKLNSAPAVPDFVIKAAFGDRAADYAATMEIWEIETSAYFSLLDGNINAARRLYEYALFETGGAKYLHDDNGIVAFSTLAQIQSAVNLSSIYSSTGELEKAMSLCGLASGRTRDKKLKSKILYRTALIQKDLQDIKGALLSLDYAVSLDPLNAQARLLEKQLEK